LAVGIPFFEVEWVWWAWVWIN